MAGADEAGRAALAGPLVAAACIFDWAAASAADRERLAWLEDSKDVAELGVMVQVRRDGDVKLE